jgi:hypothetical protein
MLITYSIEPGIIPARLWGSILPAKYKSIDVNHLNYLNNLYDKD